MTQQGFAESDSFSGMYTTGLSIKATESTPQARKDLLSLPQIRNYVQHMDSAETAESDAQLHSSETLQRRWLSLALDTQLRDSVKNLAESGSSHMAQGLSEEDG